MVYIISGLVVNHPQNIRLSWFDSFSQFGSIWIRFGIFDLFQGKLSFARLGYLDFWGGLVLNHPQNNFWGGKGSIQISLSKNRWSKS